MRQVSMIESTTFQRISRNPMPRVSVFTLGMRTRTVYPNSCGSPPFATCTRLFPPGTSSTPSGGVGVFEFYPWYASLSHCLNCSAWRWVCLPALRVCRQRNTVSTSTSDGFTFITCTGSTCDLSVQCCL